MENKNDAYGGFIVSKNVQVGFPIKFSYRDKSSIPQLNGWTLLSETDDSEYISNPDNFVIINAESIYALAPVMLEIFDAPFGTDLLWQYEEGVLTGFYDLIREKEATVDEILLKI